MKGNGSKLDTFQWTEKFFSLQFRVKTGGTGSRSKKNNSNMILHVKVSNRIDHRR